MSTTTTIPRTRTISRSGSSILLTPSKRCRTDAAETSRSKKDADTRLGENEVTEPAQPTPAEILRWTFSKAAIASCFVRDIFEMKECGLRDVEYFWLGRIPCRTVRIVGLVVGVQVWEKRTVYTLDDGTAVVDCALAHAQAKPPPPSPVKPKSPVKPAPSSRATTKGMKSSYADYLPSARRVPLSSSMVSSSVSSSSSATSSRRIVPELPLAPKPVARVGQSARVVGRVVVRHDTRIVLVDEIVPCASYNEESDHCVAVSDLHHTTYYPHEPLPPFIPPPLPTPIASQYPRPTSPSKRATPQEPQTPAFIRSVASSTTTSPSTIASSSPTSSTTSEYKVPRLRHPSRLHTRDLTANTFRIYIKHYMDNAPPPPRPRRRARSRSSSPSPTPRHSQSRKDDLGTPTRSRPGVGTDATPRLSRMMAPSSDRTPRPSFLSGAASDDESEDESHGDDPMYGYTLSHLRRVPELSLLARRVVKADAHRRAKEERKREKAQGSRSQQPSASSSSSTSARASHATADASLGPAVKRLFKQAIRMLFSEGDIVLWNGPVHPLPVTALDAFTHSSSGLWKANTSTSSTASTSSASASRYEEWEEEEALSDPTPNEEAYVPLTPAYFSRVLEGAIRTIVAESASPAGQTSGEATPKQRKSAGRSTSLIERLRAQERASTGPPPGPTKEELLEWLRRSDERWARVGEWTVEEALGWGRREGRLWCVGKGRWEVCA